MDGAIETVISFIRTYAYWFIFGWLVVENTLFLGVLVPGITVLLVAGLLIHSGDIHPVWAVVAGVAGTLIGDNINYAIGRWGLRRLRWVQRVLDEGGSVHSFIERYPAWVYIFFHFPVYLRTAFPLTLGSMRFSVRTWLWIDAVAAPLFVGTFMALGYALASVFEEAADITRVGNYVIIAFSLLFAYWTYSFVRVIVQSIRNRSSQPSDAERGQSGTEGEQGPTGDATAPPPSAGDGALPGEPPAQPETASREHDA